MRVVPAFHGGGPEIEPSTSSSPLAASHGCDPARRRRRDRVQLDEQRTRLDRRQPRRTVACGDCGSLVGGTIERMTSASRTTASEVGQELELRPRGEPSGPLASPCDRCDDANASPPERGTDCAPHRARADDGNASVAGPPLELTGGSGA